MKHGVACGYWGHMKVKRGKHQAHGFGGNPSILFLPESPLHTTTSQVSSFSFNFFSLFSPLSRVFYFDSYYLVDDNFEKPKDVFLKIKK